MARRNRKNGRFTKSTRRRRSKPKLSLTNTAQSILVADAVSRGMFSVPLMTFLGLSQNFPGGQNNSWELTLRELVDVGLGGSGNISSTGFPGGVTEVLKRNFKENATKMIASAVLIPVGFKIGTKLLRKPVIQPMNKLIKMTGLGSEVKV